MGNMERKQYFILILGGVILSIAGVLSLSTSPALGITEAKCRARAEEIKTRTQEEEMDPDTVTFGPFTNTCPNLCTGAEEQIEGKTFELVAGQSGVTIVSAFSWKFLNPGGVATDDELYADSIFGTVAFFCADGRVLLGNTTPGDLFGAGGEVTCLVVTQRCEAPPQ